MKQILQESFIEGYRTKAISSDLIFDEVSKKYAIEQFEKWYRDFGRKVL